MDRPELETRSATFAKQIFALCDLIRTRPGGFEPANQLQDAASSAAANYRASGRSRSPKEFVAKIGVVSEETDEAVYWLEFVSQTRLFTGPQLDVLLQEAHELRAIFAASYGTSRRNQKTREQRQQRQKNRHRRNAPENRKSSDR